MCELLSTLPRELPAAIVVLQHTSRGSSLPRVLTRFTPFVAKFAEPGETFRNQTVYVAPPGHHLVANPDRTVALSSRRRVRCPRPSIDWWLDSAAVTFYQRCFAVILSGTLSDGARGIQSVKRAGGSVIAQTPSSCLFAGMPNAAISTGCVDFVLEPKEIASLLRTIFDGIDRTGVDENWERPFLASAPPGHVDDIHAFAHVSSGPPQRGVGA